MPMLLQALLLENVKQVVSMLIAVALVNEVIKFASSLLRGRNVETGASIDCLRRSDSSLMSGSGLGFV